MKSSNRVLTYAERMEKELNELLERMERIRSFTKTEAWKHVEQIDRELLGAQYSAMQSYARILNVRLKIAYGREAKRSGK